MSLSTHETYSLARVAPQASPGQSGGSIRNPNRSSAIDSKYALDARVVSRLSFNYGPANQGSGPPERARAGAGRPHEEHGALLRPIGRAVVAREIGRSASISGHFVGSVSESEPTRPTGDEDTIVNVSDPAPDVPPPRADLD